jgi:hypothetical protein
MNRASPFATTVAIAIAIVSLASTAPAYGVVTEPTPGTSGYQPWPTARPGGDQQATEQQNFNTYYSNPVYTATDPSSDQRDADAEDYLLGVFGDLEKISPELWTAARSPYAADLINVGRQLPYVLRAAGPNITPIAATDTQNLDLANRWLQSMDLTSEGLANPDPATRQAIRELEDTVVPNYLETHCYNTYLAQGYSPTVAAVRAKRSAAGILAAQKSNLSFNAAQGAQLRDWYYNGIDYISNRKKLNTLRNFQRVAEYATQRFPDRTNNPVVAKTVRRAVDAIGAYAPGKVDKGGTPYPDPRDAPIPNQCPTNYVCPPLADPPS